MTIATSLNLSSESCRRSRRHRPATNTASDPGSDYRPDDSLNAAFAGLPIAGDGSLSVDDRRIGDTGVLGQMIVRVKMAGGEDVDDGVDLAAPSSGPSGTTTHSFQISESGPAGIVRLDLALEFHPLVNQTIRQGSSQASNRLSDILQ